MKAIILLIAVFAFEQGASLKPSRVGQLSSSSAVLGPNGLVFLLNTTAIYIRNFQSRSVAGQFCAGVVEGNNVFLQESGFDANYSKSDVELSLPYPISVANLSWVGVCANGSSNTVLASAIISPQLVTNVPCNTTLIGELPAGSNNIAGRVYLLNRETFAVIGFSIDITTDAVFWLGSGSTPSISGMLAPYGDNIMTKLPVVNDQDILVRVPRTAVGTAITNFAVWCRAQNEALSFISVDAGLIPTTPPPPTGTPRVSLGSFRTRQHNVRGNVYALDERTLMLENFFYDGTAPAGFFWAVRGSSVHSSNYWLVPDETGRTTALGSYTDRTLVLTLPDGITVNTIDWFAVWCRQFSINFGELRIPDNLQLGVTAPTLPPIVPCPPIRSAVTMNCKQLAPDMTVSWIINRLSSSITITLCGCIQDSDYMAFGISGDPNGVRMVGGDVTWAWMDSKGVNARDLYLSAYSQCQFTSTSPTGSTGACPDQQNDVTSVTGFREGCTTCIKYQRPLSTGDSQDSSYSLDADQSIIWAMGPVGNIRTPTQDTIPVPFRHYLNADPSGGAIRINFNRTTRDECNLQCSSTSCEERVTPWKQPVLSLEETTIRAQIGQSGGERGYAGITGQSGWGIAWYLNGLLIPNITVIRGRTYRFIVEGGNDPGQPARYHPFYITSSERGGFLVTGQQSDETIYAGFDGNRPIGVGRYCEYGNKEQDRSSEFSNFTSYRTSLELTCEDGSPGEFTWTPDRNTPDIVYYQCATHQFLGYQIRVSAAARSSSAIGLFIITIIGLLCAAAL